MFNFPFLATRFIGSQKNKNLHNSRWPSVDGGGNSLCSSDDCDSILGRSICKCKSIREAQSRKSIGIIRYDWGESSQYDPWDSETRVQKEHEEAAGLGVRSTHEVAWQSNFLDGICHSTQGSGALGVCRQTRPILRAILPRYLSNFHRLLAIDILHWQENLSKALWNHEEFATGERQNWVRIEGSRRALSQNMQLDGE